MDRNIATACMCYCILKLSLFVIALVTIFATIFALPPAIHISIVLILAMSGVLLSGVADKSIIQKRE